MKHRKNSSKTVRRFLSGAIVMGLLGMSSAAMALDKNDILSLQAAGLDPNVIINVIRSSTEPVTMTQQDIDDLRVAGVAQPVLDELCLRVGCGAAPAGGFNPGGNMAPGLQQEMERRRQLEAERIRVEQERMEQERAAMRQRIEQEEARRAGMAQAVVELDRAERMVESGRVADAAVVFWNFLEVQQPSADSAEYYRALTGFVRSMHAQGFRYSIRAQALEAVLFGPTSDAFEDMFMILADIARDVDYLSPQFDAFSGYAIGSMSAEFQDEFNFFLGRYFWTYGEYSRALEFFSRVSDSSQDKPKAHYLSGVMQLEENQNSAAYESFTRAAMSAEELENVEVGELAYLALGRFSYQIGQYDAALYYYNKVDADSFRHPRALYESMWTYFMKGDFNRALGAVHSLQSPYYSNWYFPELGVIEAAAYQYTCHLGSAEEALAEFMASNEAVQQPTQAYIAETLDPAAYWETIQTWHEAQAAGEETDLPREAVAYILSDTEFVNQLDLMERMESETEQLSELDSGLSGFATTASSAIEADLNTKRIESGLKLSAMVNSFEEEVSEWRIKAQEVGIEITTARLDLISVQLEGGATGQAGSSVFVLAQDWQLWPFEGEYWIDEVDHYRGNVSNLRNDAGQCFLPAEPTITE